MATLVGGGGVVSPALPVTLKLTNTNTVNAEGNRIYLTDTTGNYSLSNLGGYGLPNEDRNTMALVVIGINKTTTGDVAVSFEPYNPLSTAVFNAVISKDGWYVFSLLKIPFYNEALLNDYVAGTILYDTTYFKVIKIIETSTTVGSITTIVKSTVEVSLIDLQNSTLVKSTVETFFIANNSKTKLKLNTVISDLIYNETGFTDKTLIRQKDNYNLVRSVLQGAIYEFCRGNKFVAQRDIEFLNTNNYVSI